jgi:NAD(P)-dependent dehydrogenase (short-subunit alcohol dehydrogenase family)
MTQQLDTDSASDHSNRLDGVRAAITGGTSGLGLALVGELLRRGARVAFVARTRERVAAVARAYSGSHGIAGDVARKEDIHPIALQVVGNLGGLDVLVNNASSLGPVPLALLADTECEDLELALATNVIGPFRLTRALLGALGASAREGRGSVVLNVSSDAAINAYPMWGAYGASKAALHHMSRIWDEEIGVEGIRVLSLDPGDMDTPLHEAAVPGSDPATLKRPETAAREIADAIAAALPVRRAEADSSMFILSPATRAHPVPVDAPPRTGPSAPALVEGDSKDRPQPETGA